MFGVLGVKPLFSWNLWISSESREEASLGSYGLVQQIQWILVGEFERIHMWLSPTVGARKIALIYNRRHLHAIMAFNTVEFPLVTLPVSQQ
jgi:hypothetical protein